MDRVEREERRLPEGSGTDKLGVLYSINQKSMSTQFAADLRLARRKAGFTLKDVAHLLDQHPGTVSALEIGKREPSIIQLCTLAVIYGRSFQSLFDGHIDQAKADLRTRLSSLPEPRPTWPGRSVRSHNLSRLQIRLEVTDADDGAA